MSEGRLRWEIDHVLKEIDEFQNYLLPEVAAHDPRLFATQHESAAPRWTDRYRSLSEWQAAAGSLRGVLAAELTALPRTFNFTWFQQFMWAEPNINYVIENDRIRWQIACFGSLDWAQLVNWTVLPDECRPRNSEDTARSVEAMKRWLRTGSPHNLVLWDCLVGVLPMIADREPDFAWNLLDLDDWRKRAEAVRFASDVRRTDSDVERHLTNVIHNAVIHVIGALANNHFSEVKAYLDHPAFVGQSARLVPRYLMAVLCGKVYVLQKLCPNTSITDRRSGGWSLG